jgi:cysteine-rich CWC protein
VSSSFKAHSPELQDDGAVSAGYTAQVNALRCPLCGAANDCGIALGHGTCWCFSASVPPEVLAKVPADQRNQVCVCRQCVESAAPARIETSSEEPIR